MSTLVAIRHGQARPFESDSDRLSETGEEQARALARWWMREGASFDEVWCGTLLRQRRTEELVAHSFRTAGLAWPEARVTADLNEHAEGVLRPQLFPELAAAWEAERTNRNFQKLLEASMSAWLEGRITGVQPWVGFRDRVRSALARIQAGGSSRRVAAFTSGGPIGVMVAAALGAPDRAALEINWRVRNCSLTEFVFSADRLSLDSFNATPHLEEAALRTFR